MVARLTYSASKVPTGKLLPYVHVLLGLTTIAHDFRFTNVSVLARFIQIAIARQSDSLPLCCIVVFPGTGTCVRRRPAYHHVRFEKTTLHLAGARLRSVMHNRVVLCH